MARIHVYLVCGFFGAGKTTFLKNVRDELIHSRSVAFLVNEYGDSRIDGARLDDGIVNITGIDGGSIFCSCRHWDFIEALKELVKSITDTIIIESPGLADPSPLAGDIAIVKSLAGDLLDYRGNICVIDAVNFLDQLDVFEAIGKQVANSGIILLNKIDLASPGTVEADKQKVMELAPDAIIFQTVNARLPFDRVERILASAHLLEAQEGTNTPDNRPGSMLLEARNGIEQDAIQAFLEGLAGHVLRVKGQCLLENGYHEVDLSGNDVKLQPSSKVHDQTALLVILSPGSTSMEMIEEHWKNLIAEHSIAQDIE